MATQYGSDGTPVTGVYKIVPAEDNNLLWDIEGGNPGDRNEIQLYTPNEGPDGRGGHQKFLLYHIPDTDLVYFYDCCMGYGYFLLEWQSRINSGTRGIEGTNAEIDKVINKTRDCWKRIELWNADTGGYPNQYYYQRWRLLPTEYNGKKCFYIQSYGAPKYVIDVMNYDDYDSGYNDYYNEKGRWQFRGGNDLVMWPKDDKDAKNQKFEFIKDIKVNPNLPTPANVGLTYDPINSANIYTGTIGIDASRINDYPYLYIGWICSANDYQVSYRWSGRPTGSDVYNPSWSAWTTLSGSTDEEGWGDVWNDNLTNVDKNSQWYSSATKVTNGNARISLPLNFAKSGGHDLIEVEIRVRSFGFGNAGVTWRNTNNWSYNNIITLPYCSMTAYQKCSILWIPTPTITSFGFSPQGLKISYESDFQHDNNYIKIGKIRGPKGYITNREFTFQARPYKGTITIPMRELNYIPENAEEYSFSFYIQTCDGQGRSTSVTKPISYNAGSLFIHGYFSYHDGGIVKFKPITSYLNGECHIIYEQDGETIISDCEKNIDGHWIIIPPFDNDYLVMFSAEASETVWGVKTWQGQVIHGEGHMFNFGEDYFRLFLQENPYTGPETSYSADSQAHLLTGDRRESVFFGKGAQVSQSVSGLVPIDPTKQLDGAKYPYPTNCSLEDFHRMRNAKYAIYRDLYGRRYDVAIVSTSESPKMENIFNVSISMKERM